LFHFIRDVQDSLWGKSPWVESAASARAQVSESFVIVHPMARDPEDVLAKHLPLSVTDPRPCVSAMSEDGLRASFAGQFETYLNVTGVEAVKAAIGKCVAAASSDRVSLYSGVHDRG